MLELKLASNTCSCLQLRLPYSVRVNATVELGDKELFGNPKIVP